MIKNSLVVLCGTAMIGCVPVAVVIPDEPEEVVLFSICNPPKGEEQDVIRLMRGKGFNSVEYGCI